MIIVRHTHIIKKGEIYQKPKSLVVWVGEPDFSFLFKRCEIELDSSQGDLCSNVENKKSFTSRPSGVYKVTQQH